MTGIILLVTLINICIVFVSIVKIPKSNKIKNYFVLFVISTTLWTFSNMLLSYYELYVYFRLAYATGAMMMITGTMFISAFVNSRIYQRVNISLIISGLVLFAVCMIDGIFYVGSGKEYTVTPWINIYSVILFSCLLYMIIRMLISLNRLKNGERLQAKYMTLGVVTFGGGSLIVSFILPMFGIGQFLLLDSTFSLSFVGFSFYAILTGYMNEHNKMKSEMTVAEKIQLSILPTMHDYEDLEISAIMQPAEEIGGDYFDIYAKDENLWIANGDVTGHGLTSGLIAMMAQTAFLTSIESGVENTEQLYILMNRVLQENIRTRLKADHFMSMSIMKYNGDGNFSQSGGHTDFLIYRKKTDTFEEHRTEGIYLGMLKDCSKATFTHDFKLEQSDMMIIVSDGIIESMTETKQMYGLEGVKNIVRKNKEMPNCRIIQRLLKDCLEWCNGEQKDDITVMIIRRK